MKVKQSVTRPADTTAYAANDAIANNTSAGSVTVLQFTGSFNDGYITKVKIAKTDQTVATPTIRVWFYEVAPTPGAGDNAAFAHPATNSIGFVDVAVVNAGSDDAVGFTNSLVPYSGGSIYALLQTLSAFTPASEEVFKVEVWLNP